MARKPPRPGGQRRARGLCPVYKRDMAVLSDGVVSTAHRRWLPDGPKCPGRGQKALPLEGGA